MKVTDLIAYLQQQDPEAPVLVDLDYTYAPVTTLRILHENVVIG